MRRTALMITLLLVVVMGFSDVGWAGTTLTRPMAMTDDGRIIYYPTSEATALKTCSSAAETTCVLTWFDGTTVREKHLCNGVDCTPGPFATRDDVEAVATGNVLISNPGTAVFDGVTLTTGQSLLLPFQDTRSQNGIYTFDTSSTPLERRTDVDVSAEFADSFEFIALPGGTDYGNTLWRFLRTSAVTLETTELIFVQASVGPTVERTTRKDQAGGYLGATSPGANIKPAALAGYVALSPLSAASAINIGSDAVTVGIEGSGGAVTLDNADPRITGCGAGDEGRFLTLLGIGNPVTIPNGQGVLLAGDTGSVTVAPNVASPSFRCRDSVWEEEGVRDLQRVLDAGRIATGLTSAAPLRLGEETTYFDIFVDAGEPVIDATCAGGPCPIRQNIKTGASWLLLGNGTLFEEITDLGVHTYSGAGRPRKAIFFGAAAISTDGTNCTTPEEEALTGGPKDWIFTCANSTGSIFYGNVAMDRTGWNGGAVRFTLHTFHGASEVITFGGAFSAQCQGDGEAVTSTWGTAVTTNVVTQTLANQYQKQESADVTPSGTCAPGDFLSWRYVRTVQSANSANTRIRGVTMSYLQGTRSGNDE